MKQKKVSIREEIYQIKKAVKLNGIVLSIILFMVLGTMGAMLNVLVISVNDGRMPVELNYHYESDTHFTYQNKNEINKYYLSDRYTILNVVYSVGDFMILGSNVIVLYLVVRLVYYSFKL